MFNLKKVLTFIKEKNCATLLSKYINTFKSIFEKSLLNVKKLCKRTLSQKAGVVIAVTLIASITATMVCYAAQCDAALSVIVNGRKMGCVKDVTEAQLLEKQVRSSARGDIDEFLTIEYKETISFGQTSDIEYLAVDILNSTDRLNKVCGLYVDSIITAFADSSDEIEENLKLLADTYLAEGAVFKGYANSVEIKDAYLTDDAFSGLVNSVEGYLDGRTGVQIVTSRIENYDEEVPFDTNIIYDESHKSGYSKVLKRGKNGLNNVTADVIYVNGNRVDANVITCTQIVVPVTASVKKGLCEEAIENIRINHTLSSSENSVELFTFPCEINDRTYVSSYWGDGRNHKGVDIVNPKGAKIYAAADGVVSFSGWYGAYGKCIIIDHYDGKTQTLYSHNSANLVEKGAKVTAGQTIAEVGETGNATGNHLHFSVLVNGKQVNPDVYLGFAD